MGNIVYFNQYTELTEAEILVRTYLGMEAYAVYNIWYRHLIRMRRPHFKPDKLKLFATSLNLNLNMLNEIVKLLAEEKIIKRVNRYKFTLLPVQAEVDRINAISEIKRNNALGGSVPLEDARAKNQMPNDQIQLAISEAARLSLADEIWVERARSYLGKNDKPLNEGIFKRDIVAFGKMLEARGVKTKTVIDFKDHFIKTQNAQTKA